MTGCLLPPQADLQGSSVGLVHLPGCRMPSANSSHTVEGITCPRGGWPGWYLALPLTSPERFPSLLLFPYLLKDNAA